MEINELFTAGLFNKEREMTMSLLNDYTLKELANKVEDDEHLLFMELLDYDVPAHVLESIISFIKINKEEIHNNNNELLYA